MVYIFTRHFVIMFKTEYFYLKIGNRVLFINLLSSILNNFSLASSLTILYFFSDIHPQVYCKGVPYIKKCILKV